MSAVTVTPLPSGAQLTTINHGRYKTHSYQAPDKYFGDTSHIIETPCKVIIIDSQYLKPFAQELRSIVDSLEKEIVGIIISHPHPDHFLGLGAAFTDIPIYAIPAVQKVIADKGQAMLEESLQTIPEEMLADKVVVPNHLLCPGHIEVDGLHIILMFLQKGEAKDQVVIKLPQLKTIIVQDLAYNGFHPWLSKYIGHWRRILCTFRDDCCYRIVLVGHGPPANHDIFAKMITYLDTAYTISCHSQTIGKFKEQLIEAYPNLEGAKLINMYSETLFKGFP